MKNEKISTIATVAKKEKTESEKVLQIQKDLGIDEKDVKTEITNFAKMSYGYAEKFLKLDAKVKLATANFERTAARLDGKARESTILDGNKITEKGIENLIKADDEYSAASNILITATIERDEIGIILQSLDKKQNSLNLMVTGGMI